MTQSKSQSQPIAVSPILARIRKLMALSDRAGTPHEAAVASSKMQELLTEFNLTRAEVEASNPDTGVAKVVDAPREKTNHARAALYKYQRDLMSTLCANNFCMHLVRVNRNKVRYNPETADYEKTPFAKSHVLIGRSENVAATILMYDHLTETMNRLLPFEGAERRSTDARLWLAGCTETLCGRLVDQRTRREREEARRNSGKASNQTPGLVRLTDLYATEDDLNEDFRLGLDAGTTTRERLEREAEARKEAEERERISAAQRDLVAGGMNTYDAFYVARGLKVPAGDSAAPGPARVGVETSSQRRRRRVSRSYSDRSYYAELRRERREAERRDNPSFQDGQQRGKDIGLGGGLKAGKSTPKKLGDGQ